MIACRLLCLNQKKKKVRMKGAISHVLRYNPGSFLDFNSKLNTNKVSVNKVDK